MGVCMWYHRPPMNRWILSALTLAALPALASPEAVKNLQTPQKGVAAVLSFGGEGNRDFMLDGKPFQIRSGEMHPQRIPRSHWQHRIRAAKAMGLNTIAFYVFWNQLEKEDGSWDFRGMNDIAAFIDLCREEGMWVLFRPGPYTCGEWDMGGLPAYLIKDGPADLRWLGNDAFMAAQTRYLDKMAEIVVPRLSKNGGNVLMVQLENEYGSYNSGHDEKAYIEWLKDYWTKKGAGPFYLSEGSSLHHLRFVIPDVAVGLDPADCEANMTNAKAVAPNVPVFSSETYPGWLRHWGEGNWMPTDKSATMRWYMESGTSFNLFVLHGGTSFGLTAGANSNADGSDFQPDLTSYDYGSPIGEHGNLTPEYHRYRDIIAAALPSEAAVPEPPAVPESMEIPAFTPVRVAPFSLLGFERSSVRGTTNTPIPLEFAGQNQGIAVYRTQLPAGEAAELHADVHDFAQVYVDNAYIGTIDRSEGQQSIMLPARAEKAALRIVVDTFGHVNFGSYTEKDNKGIIGKVTLGACPVGGWSMELLRLKLPPLYGKRSPARAASEPAYKGGLFKAEVVLDKVADTFLDMSAWHKGYVWVNGHNLGRYWEKGPQFRLYCPAEFLKQGENTVTVLDTFAEKAQPISGKTERNTEVTKRTESLNNEW